MSRYPDKLELARDLAELELARVDVAEREERLYEQYCSAKRVLVNTTAQGNTEWLIKNGSKYADIVQKVSAALGPQRIAELDNEQ